MTSIQKINLFPSVIFALCVKVHHEKDTSDVPLIYSHSELGLGVAFDIYVKSCKVMFIFDLQYKLTVTGTTQCYKVPGSVQSVQI